MKMMVEFDINADIIEVPECVVKDREILRGRFLKWLYNKSVKHKYWVNFLDGSRGVCYRSDAFVEWLNKKRLKDYPEKAMVLEQEVDSDANRHLPSIFF